MITPRSLVDEADRRSHAQIGFDQISPSASSTYVEEKINSLQVVLEVRVGVM